MSVQAGGDQRCGIGTRLRAGRERKGLTVLQAAEKLHVDPKILESLESEDFQALGAPVFVRGHLRHYAELVGEQPSELQALYANSIRVVPPDLTQIPKAKAPSDARRLAVPATVVLLVFAIAGGVWWVVTLQKGHPRSTPVPAAATSAATLPAAAALPSVEAASLGAPGAAPSAPATSATAVSPAPTATARPVRTASDSRTGQAAGDARLTLRFTAKSWVEVYDSSGERLFYDVGAADSVRTLKGTPPLRVVLGNAPGVAVEVNGHTTDLASLTHPDGTAQFVVSETGRVSKRPH